MPDLENHLRHKNKISVKLYEECFMDFWIIAVSNFLEIQKLHPDRFVLYLLGWRCVLCGFVFFFHFPCISISSYFLNYVIHRKRSCTFLRVFRYYYELSSIHLNANLSQHWTSLYNLSNVSIVFAWYTTHLPFILHFRNSYKKGKFLFESCSFCFRWGRGTLVGTEPWALALSYSSRFFLSLR